jgi:hypothetical protein
VASPGLSHHLRQRNPRVETPIYMPTPFSLMKTLKPVSLTSKPTQYNETASFGDQKLLIFRCMPIFHPARRDRPGDATMPLHTTIK